MNESDHDLLPEFRQTLTDCRQLYLTSGVELARDHGHLLRQASSDFVNLMDDLHRGLVVKCYLTVALSDRKWSAGERRLAEALVEHVWGKTLKGRELRQAVEGLFERSKRLTWYSVIRPFCQYPPLSNYAADVETVVMRLANLVAKADGHLIDSTRQALQHLQAELETHLYQLHVSDPTLERTDGDTPTVQQLLPTAEPRPSTPPSSATNLIEPASREDMFAEAMKELDGLIGLESIKNEVKSLVNFLQLQRHRQEAGMPAMQITLHMVFDGNPGTGKTTVARIVGRLLGGMGIVSKGHVVEVDRSDLVAQYAGQTGPRTNKKIDEALDGILFIDEAYSLVARGEDAYGQEALQALLKRMEDDRHRLIVILAGYPGPMTQLLKANPGLSSRFNRRLLFADYNPADLGRIFARLCALNHYQLKPEVRKKLLIGFDWLFQHRDEHFGNGRVVRNLFEDSIRHMANRICSVAPLTKELLANLDEADIRFENVPVEAMLRAEQRVRFQMHCPGCHQRCTFNADFITQQVKCPNCQAPFLVDWPEPVINRTRD